MANNLDFRVKNGLAVTTTATVEGATQSTSTNTGALQVQGGTGIAKDLFVGGSINVAQTLLVTNTATFSGAAIYNGSVRVNPATSSTTTGTGALVVVGGVGIGGTLNVGGDFNVVGTIYGTIVGNISTATHLANGTLGQVPYQTDAGRTGFYGPGTLGQLLVSGGTAAPVYTNTASIYVGRATLADSATAVVGGSLGTLVYQTGSGATGFVSVGTAGQLLMSAGASVPVYTNTASIYVGRATLADSVTTVAITNDVATATPQYITFVSTSTGNAGIKTAATTGITYIPSSGYVGIGTASPSNRLEIYQLNASAADNSAKLRITSDYGSATSTGFGGSISYWDRTPGNLLIESARIETQQRTSNNASNLVFYTNSGGGSSLNNTEKIRIQYDGNVGIGISSPTAKLHVAGGAIITGTTTVTNVTEASSTITGAFQVYGGAGIGGSIFVGNTATILSTAASTSTGGANALYVAGGAYIAKTLTVNGQAVFQNDVIFAGTTTYVYSTNTVYTDNILELHSPGSSATWTVDDGKDIGLRFHYYNGADKSAFLGLTNDTKYLEWYNTGAESTGTSTIFTSATYGTFKTGSILLTNTTASTTTATGALVVAGGVGVGGDLRVGGIIYGIASVSGTITTATSLAAGTDGQLVYQSNPGVTAYYGPGTIGQILTSNGTSGPLYVNTASIYVGSAGVAVTATNLALGTIGQVPYQTAPGLTSFYGPGTAGQLLVSGGAAIPVYTNTASIYVGYASNADTLKALAQSGNANYYPTFVNANNATAAYSAYYTTSSFVINAASGFVGVGVATPTSKLDVSGAVRISGVTTVTNTTDASSTITGALQVYGGVGVGGNSYIGGSETITGNLAVNGGSLTSAATTFNLINATASTVNFAGAGTAITVGAATGFTAIRNLTTLTNTTAATSTATGALQVYGGAGIGGSLYVGGTIYGTFSGSITGTASTATHIEGGTLGQVPYQTAPGRTSFYGPGTLGQLLVSGGAAVPVYTNTASIGVGKASNIIGGATGSLPYQSAIDTTTFLGLGTLGYVLTAAASAPVWSPTSGITAGQADALKTIAQPANLIYYPTFVDSNNPTAAYEAYYTTSSFAINASTGYVGLGVATPTTKLDVAGAVRITGITTVTNVTASVSTTTGALQVYGGIGVGDSIYIKNRVGFVNTSNVSAVYQMFNAVTNSLDTVFA